MPSVHRGIDRDEVAVGDRMVDVVVQAGECGAATAQSSSRASGPWTLDDGGWIRLWFRFGVLVVGCLPVPIVQVIQVVVVGDGAVAASRRSTIGPAGGAQPGPPGGGTGFPVPINRALLTTHASSTASSTMAAGGNAPR